MQLTLVARPIIVASRVWSSLLPSLALVVATLLLQAAPETKPTLVVAGLQAVDVRSRDAKTLEEMVRALVVRSGRYTLVTPEENNALDGPDLLLFDSDGEEMQRIDLTRLQSLANIHKLLKMLGVREKYLSHRLYICIIIIVVCNRKIANFVKKTCSCLIF